MRVSIGFSRRALRLRLRRASERELREAYIDSDEFVAAVSALATPISEALSEAVRLADSGLAHKAPELALAHEAVRRSVLYLRAICEAYDVREEIGYLEYRKRYPKAPKFGEQRAEFSQEWEPAFRRSLGLPEPRPYAPLDMWHLLNRPITGP